LPEGVARQEVAKVGLRVRKILKSSTDPVETMLQHFPEISLDLIVWATHQREGVARWLHKAVAEPHGASFASHDTFYSLGGKGVCFAR